MFKIYLVGYISGQKIEECTGWRRKIKETAGIEKFTWLDPLNHHEIDNIDKEGLTSNITPEAIMHRDYNSTKAADLIIANLDTFGAERPVTGSIFELAWAYEWKKPVIVITTNPNYIHHPFITATASVIFSSVDELLDSCYLDYFRDGVKR